MKKHTLAGALTFSLLTAASQAALFGLRRRR